MAWPFILLVIAMLTVVAVLFWGLFSMARGGEYNARWSNLIMRWRVVLQAFAVLVFVLIMLAAGQ
jgi:hypothetical protein